MENVAIDFKNHFNNYVQNLETYIMFQIKQRTLELTEELTKKRQKAYLSFNGCTGWYGSKICGWYFKKLPRWPIQIHNIILPQKVKNSFDWSCYWKNEIKI